VGFDIPPRTRGRVRGGGRRLGRESGDTTPGSAANTVDAPSASRASGPNTVFAVLRRRVTPPDTGIEQRLRRFERRLEDAEDALAASLAPERIDDLDHRLEELALTSPTTDDVLRLRVEVARMAAEITKVRAELQAELDQVTAALLDVADSRIPRRAAG
jgi:hypothetical protein